MSKVQKQPVETKVTFIDDFSEDIHSLAEKVEKEGQKEAFSMVLGFNIVLGRQFNVTHNLGDKQLGNFLAEYDVQANKLDEIIEEAENGTEVEDIFT